MATEADEIMQWALTLSAEERAQVARTLLASLDDPADLADVQKAWTTESASRVDDLVSGKVKTIPGEQVFAELAARRAARQAARDA